MLQYFCVVSVFSRILLPHPYLLGQESVTKKSHKTRVFDVSKTVEVEEAFELVEREDGELEGNWSLVAIANNDISIVGEESNLEEGEFTLVTCHKKSALKARPTVGWKAATAPTSNFSPFLSLFYSYVVTDTITYFNQ